MPTSTATPFHVNHLADISTYVWTEADAEEVLIRSAAAHVDNTPALLRSLAAMLEAEPDLLLISVANVCSGEPWEATLQVVVTRLRPVGGAK